MKFLVILAAQLESPILLVDKAFKLEFRLNSILKVDTIKTMDRVIGRERHLAR